MRPLFRTSPFFIFIFLLFPLHAAAADVGFVASNGISFSKDPVFANASVKAYVVIVNNVYTKLNATVAFFDNNAQFTETVATVPLETAQQINVPWTPVLGQHTVSAKIISATATDASGATTQLSADELHTLSAAPVSASLFVDADTDGDGIGDNTELTVYHTSPTSADSDHDGLTDFEEIFKYKTDPNNPNTDGDNMNDGDEVRVGRNPLVKDDPPPPPAPAPAPIAPTPAPKPAIKKAAVLAPIPLPPATTPQPQLKKIKEITLAAAPPLDPTPTVTPSSNTTSTMQAATVDSPMPQNQEPDGNSQWIKVLGIIAGLCAVAAGVSGMLAWREKNRF